MQPLIIVCGEGVEGRGRGTSACVRGWKRSAISWLTIIFPSCMDLTFLTILDPPQAHVHTCVGVDICRCVCVWFNNVCVHGSVSCEYGNLLYPAHILPMLYMQPYIHHTLSKLANSCRTSADGDMKIHCTNLQL